MGRFMYVLARVVAAVAVAVAFVVIPLPAFASVNTATSSPGPDYVQGIALGDFPASAAASYSSPVDGCKSSGGWSTDPYFTFSTHYDHSKNSTGMAAGRVCDPVFAAGFADGPALVLGYTATELACNASDCIGPMIDIGGRLPTGVTCARSEWSLAADQFRRGFDSSSTLNTSPGPIPAGATYTKILTVATGAECPYVVSIDTAATKYVGGIGIYDSQLPPLSWSWSASGFLTPRTYGSFNAAKLACNDSTNDPNLSPDCTGLVPVNVSKLCDSPPLPLWHPDAWANFSDFVPIIFNSVGPTVNFYAKCLFYPAGGFDRFGDVTTAWSIGPFGKIQATLTSTMQSLTVLGGGCGPLTPTTLSGPMKGFAINTCGWPNAATSPMRGIIGTGLVIMSGWFIIRMIIDITVGVLNKQTPNPIAGKDSK